MSTSKFNSMHSLTLNIFLLYFTIIYGTIDLNLSELQYLADHLHPEECRRLVAALHFKSYQQPNALDQAESKVSKDIPCIRLLLHWNSEKGQGKGETHEVVQHRLRQLGRIDLADWLGKTVFHQLGQEIEEGLNNPFVDILNATENHKPETQETQSAKWDLTQWLAFDTICWTFVAGLSLLTLIILLRAACILCKRERIKSSKRNYEQFENEPNTDSESEDRFDIRHKQNSALLLMGISEPTESVL